MTPRGAPEVPNNPGNAICRYQFLEIIVRLAGEKYKNPGVCGTFAESLSKLLNECIYTYTPDPWQEFRDEQLWTLEVTDVFEFNMEGIV